MRAEGYLEDGTWNDASLLAGLAALHCVRLASPSLPIAEQAHLRSMRCFLPSLLEWEVGGVGWRGGEMRVGVFCSPLPQALKS